MKKFRPMKIRIFSVRPQASKVGNSIGQDALQLVA